MVLATRCLLLCDPKSVLMVMMMMVMIMMKMMMVMMLRVVMIVGSIVVV